MANYPPEIWSQLKNLTKDDLQKALKRDGWILQKNKGRQGKKGANTLTFRHPDRPEDKNTVVIHFHPKQTMAPNLLKELLDYINWSQQDLYRLKLIKRIIDSDS